MSNRLYLPQFNIGPITEDDHAATPDALATVALHDVVPTPYLTRVEAIALRDKLTEWIGDDRERIDLANLCWLWGVALEREGDGEQEEAVERFRGVYGDAATAELEFLLPKMIQPEAHVRKVLGRLFR